MTYEIKRLFNGMASVRDYVIRDLIAKNETLKIKFADKIMTLTPEELKSRQIQIIPKKFKSKINPDQEYSLIDFRFVSDKKVEV